MSALYPTGLDNIPSVADGDLISATQENRQTDAINAIEATLGTNPAGTSGTVREAIAARAPLDSPAFTGIPTAPTAVAGTATTQVATTAFVHAAGSPLCPTGVIQAYAGTMAPSGWVLCDGGSYDGTDATYAQLWNLIGTTFGGTGTKSFKVPDLRGRVVLGVSATHALATTGGEEKHSLVTDEMPAHTHSASVTDSGHLHGNIPLYATNQSGDNLTWNPGAPRVYQNGQASTSPSTTGISVSNSPTGGGQAHNNLQPYLAINYIIKL